MTRSNKLHRQGELHLISTSRDFSNQTLRTLRQEATEGSETVYLLSTYPSSRCELHGPTTPFLGDRID